MFARSGERMNHFGSRVHTACGRGRRVFRGINAVRRLEIMPQLHPRKGF